MDSVDDDGADKAGAAYILTLRRNGTVITTQKISATSGGFTPNPLRTNDEFGQAITSLGDLNLDGVPDIAVTADAFNDPTRQNGTVFILFLNGSTGGATLNQPPILSPIGNRNVTEGNQLLISVSASDADGPSPLILLMPLACLQEPHSQIMAMALACSAGHLPWALQLAVRSGFHSVLRMD